MFVHYRTQGIILKKDDRGEANQLFTIYTKDFGKLKILGKAIRKTSSKLRAGADIFYLSEIEFIQGKTHKTLTDAILIDKFENIRKNLGKLKIAYKITDIFDEIVHGQEKDERLWKLVLETFSKLDNHNLEPATYNLIYYYFFWNFSSLLGYELEFYNCAICQKKLQQENIYNNAEYLKVPRSEATSGFYFNPKEGGVICNNCFQKVKKGKGIDSGTIKIIRILLKKDWQTLKRLKITSEDLKALKVVSDFSLLYLKKEVIGHI